MSYYTKYRPQTVAELDLEAARKGLSPILTSGKFSQVYLFTGPKGTGKTSSARILAKLLNCEKNRKKLAEPCNKCDSCRRITNGQSLACLEMDAASNRGIDDIRQLRERIGLAPAEGIYTVYIIDEVHMLTTEAFNALLKTLEEPPAHAVFALCTTDPQKIPDTVISRCTRIQLNKATSTEVLHSLNKAVVGEKLTAEPEALQLLASRVDGSFRDGMKLLEQLAAAGEITKTAVDGLTGYSDDYDVEIMLDALVARDIQTALGELVAKQQIGADAMVLGKRLVEELRERMLYELTHEAKQAKELVSLTKHMAEAASKLRGAVVPFVVLEIAVGEWCLAEGSTMRQRDNATTLSIELKKPKPAPPAPPALAGAFSGSVEDISKQWGAILQAVRPVHFSLESILKNAKLVGYQDGWLTIEAMYKFHKETLEQDRHRKKIEDVFSTVLGGAVHLHFTVRQAGTVGPHDNISGTVEDDALVKAAEEIFGAS